MGYGIPEDHHGPLPSRDLDQQSQSQVGARKKAQLLSVMAAAKNSIRDVRVLLETSTPQAKNLLVHKELEKLERSAEKVQMGLQELVL